MGKEKDLVLRFCGHFWKAVPCGSRVSGGVPSGRPHISGRCRNQTPIFCLPSGSRWCRSRAGGWRGMRQGQTNSNHGQGCPCHPGASHGAGADSSTRTARRAIPAGRIGCPCAAQALPHRAGTVFRNGPQTHGSRVNRATTATPVTIRPRRTSAATWVPGFLPAIRPARPPGNCRRDPAPPMHRCRAGRRTEARHPCRAGGRQVPTIRHSAAPPPLFLMPPARTRPPFIQHSKLSIQDRAAGRPIAPRKKGKAPDARPAPSANQHNQGSQEWRRRRSRPSAPRPASNAAVGSGMRAMLLPA